MRFLCLLLVIPFAASAAAEAQSGPVFYRDVLPVLQERCQSCHRPGEAAPMPFLTYDEVRPWAQAIKESVLLERMPPWFADPAVGKFKNDRSVSRREIELLARWADAGAPEGDPADAPPAKEWVEGWTIGEPDLVFEMPRPFDVPASGQVDYHYLVIPTNFEKDVWVSAAEVRPDNRSVLHHVIVFVRPPGSTWMDDAVPGEYHLPAAGRKGRDSDRRDWLTEFAPGVEGETLEPGQARRIPAGSDLVVELHYTPNGKPQTDQSRFGLIVAAGPVHTEIKTRFVATRDFAIPPGHPNYRVDAELEVKEPMTIVALMPHMHLRGKSFEYRALYPGGREEKLLSVPRYDFAWQLTYEPKEPIVLPAGAKLLATAHYDSSPNNPSNPDPTIEVGYGEQSWEEMMFGFFEVAIPVKDGTTND